MKNRTHNLPSYETANDKQNESYAKAVLERHGFTVFSFGQYSPCDFFIFGQSCSYLAEYKRRNHNYGQYQTVIMPEKKLRKLLSMAEQLGSDVLYVVQFNDGVYAAKIEDYYTTIGGRTDRNDPRDIHKVAHIGVNYFKKIG